MPLKYQIESLEGLDEATQALYTEKDGKYVLAVEGIPEPEDTSGLKRKVEELLEESKQAKDARRKAEEDAEKAREEKARKDGDHETLAKQYEEKYNTLTQQLEAERQQRSQDAVKREAISIASELAEGPNAKILARFIEDRLRYEGDSVKVADREGNLTISTIDDLKTEFRNDEAFGALVTGTKGSGSGAAGQGSGAPHKPLSEMNDAERLKFKQDNPEGFRKALQSQR